MSLDWNLRGETALREGELGHAGGEARESFFVFVFCFFRRRRGDESRGCDMI